MDRKPLHTEVHIGEKGRNRWADRSRRLTSRKQIVFVKLSKCREEQKVLSISELPRGVTHPGEQYPNVLQL